MNGRIERMTPREDFLVAAFQDDPRLVEELRKSDEGFNWEFLGAWLFILAAITAIIYGVAIAIDKGQI